MPNNLEISGNLGADPELRYFESGNCKVQFRIAVYAGKDKPSHWFTCEAWGDAAESVSNTFKKGDSVLIKGYLKLEAWESQDGTKREKAIIACNSVTKYEIKKKEEGQPAAASTKAKSRKPAPTADEDDFVDIPF